jgi:probable phosphoglycerate mutase
MAAAPSVCPLKDSPSTSQAKFSLFGASRPKKPHLIGFCDALAQYSRRMTTPLMPANPATLPRLYVIRHGETEWSRSGQHTGRTDLPLTPTGEAEARTLAPRLAGLVFDRVYSSPRLRACETCELAGLGDKIEIEPDLAEWDYGDYEGLRVEEIRAGRPDWNIYRDGCPHGESPDQIAARADRLIARLRTLTGTIALFSHGHFSRVLAVRWVDLPVPAAGYFLINTASVGLLTYEQTRSRPVIGLWNSTK